MADLIPAWVDGALMPVEKIEVHRLGLRHRAVSVFLLDGDQVLIQKRAAGKYHSAGLWANTCCTHPLWGEDSDHCATRRLEQELGITGVPVEKRHTAEYRADVGGGLIEHELVDIYTARKTPNMPLSPNPAEVEQVDWVDIGTLRNRVVERPEQYVEWLKIYLSQHLDYIFDGSVSR